MNKAIERATKEKMKLSEKYNIPVSAIVWMGGSHYIIVKDGNEIKV